MRLPVRTITWPPISSRRILFGEPTSPAPSGVVVAAFSPRPGLANRRGGLVDDGVLRGAAIGEREVVARQVELDADDVRARCTRSASSSSSCPVSSPSSTTIVFPSTVGRLYAVELRRNFEPPHFSPLFL